MDRKAHKAGRDAYLTKRDLLYLLKKLGIKSSADRGTLLPEDINMAMKSITTSYGAEFVKSMIIVDPIALKLVQEMIKSIKSP